MRTFQELAAQARSAAMKANLCLNSAEAQTWLDRAAEYDRIDRNAVAKAAARGNGPGAHHG